MAHLTRHDLYSLEKYAEIRPAFRARVIAHKKHRRVPLGDHAALYFEDALTMQYQVQEMLRIERIFEAAGIQEELDVYNPLIPDGRNWKATFMLEYPSEAERRVALSQLVGIEERIWVQIASHSRVFAVANEDLPRSTAEKTASVHFLRFDLDDAMAAAAKGGAAISAGISHPLYEAVTPLTEDVRQSLAEDLH